MADTGIAMAPIGSPVPPPGVPKSSVIKPNDCDYYVLEIVWYIDWAVIPLMDMLRWLARLGLTARPGPLSRCRYRRLIVVKRDPECSVYPRTCPSEVHSPAAGMAGHYG